MRSSLDYAGFAQLCGRSPIMREIMCTHNRIIPRSLLFNTNQVSVLCCKVININLSFYGFNSQVKLSEVRKLTIQQCLVLQTPSIKKY